MIQCLNSGQNFNPGFLLQIAQIDVSLFSLELTGEAGELVSVLTGERTE